MSGSSKGINSEASVQEDRSSLLRSQSGQYYAKQKHLYCSIEAVQMSVRVQDEETTSASDEIRGGQENIQSRASARGER